MKILIAAFECVPFVKVGGLADVAGALPAFLRKLKVDVRVILPLHKSIDRKKFGLMDTKNIFFVPMGGELQPCRVWEGKNGLVPVYFLENDKYFGRDPVYSTPEGDYPDNAQRFIFFSRAVLEACKAVDFMPDIIHCNDMHTALIPAYVKTLYRIDSFFSRTATLYAIHNIAYQGIYPAETLPLAGFSWNDFTPEKFEYYGQVNFMKAGIVFADVISTVSPTYAKEVRFSAEHGRGMEGLLESRKDDFYGILNGIDYIAWNPEKDRDIKCGYTVKKPQAVAEKKAACKTDLQKQLGLPEENVPVFGMVSRLDSVKGIGLLIEVMPRLLGMPVQLVILGSGDRKYVEKLTALSSANPGKLSFNPGFNDKLARKIYAGSDFFLMPSQSEPCGLSQMIAMRYGTVPVVRWTGGLADSVAQFDPATGKGTGFLFREFVPSSLLNSVMGAVEAYYKGPEYFKNLVLNCLKKNFSWQRPAGEYVRIYKTAVKKREKEWLNFLQQYAAKS